MAGAGEHQQRLARDEQLTHLRRAFADALVHGDEPLAEEAVSEAIGASFEEAEIDERIVAPALRLVGDLWADGRLGIADEHLATEISLRVIALQREAFRVARRRSMHRVVFAAVEGEQHVVGLRMAASMALHGGYDVRLLGPDLPLHGLLAAVRRHGPSIVGLSATMPASAARMQKSVETLHEAAPGLGIVVGGAAVDRRFELVHGVTVCRHVGDLVGQLEAQLQGAATN
jgi:methanogenic corrinoid protein MtbC1